MVYSDLNSNQHRLIGSRYGKTESIVAAPLAAKAIGATGLCVFLRTQTPKSISVTSPELQAFAQNMQLCGYNANQLIIHASYFVNLCETNQRFRSEYFRHLVAELRIAQQLGARLVVVHLGSYSKFKPADQKRDLILDLLDDALDLVSDIPVALENSAGFAAQQGAELEFIAELLIQSRHSARLGLALNTAHAFACGYDLSSTFAVDKFIQTLDHTINLSKVAAIFLNDSLAQAGSRLDIHGNLGLGDIPLQSLQHLLSTHALQTVPIILETPNPALWEQEITWVKKFSFSNHHKQEATCLKQSVHI